jgi:hypothetical protein
MRRREFISLFAGMAAACSLAAQAQESATMGTTKATTAVLPQIEVARVKPVDAMPPNLRLSDNLIDLMKDFSLSSAQGIGAAWGYHSARQRPSMSGTGNGEITLSPASMRADEVIE